MKKLFLLLVSALPLIMSAEVAKISSAEAAKLVADGKAVLVDVREPSEWAESGVAAPAVLLPKSEFDAGLTGDWKDFLAKVSPTDADLEKYYKDPANAAQFQAPETADIEYLVLDVDALKKAVSVPEEDLKKYYTENLSRHSTLISWGDAFRTCGLAICAHSAAHVCCAPRYTPCNSARHARE